MTDGIKRRDFLKVLGVTGAERDADGLLGTGATSSVRGRARGDHPRRRDLVYDGM